MIHQSRSERSSQSNNLPGESTNYKWDTTRGTDTNQSVTFIYKEQ